MQKTDTVFNLALQRLRYNKSRTLLTGIAILLTTMLLMAIGTVTVGIFNLNRQMAAFTDYHAVFRDITPAQSAILRSHIQVEALTTAEVFADIENGKMNGALAYQEIVRDDRHTDEEGASPTLQVESGHYPEAEDEICSSPAFFRRVGAEPVIGGKVTLSFRVDGKGKIQTKEFTISGLFPDEEVAEGLDDSRIMWSAQVSKVLLSQYEEAGLYQPKLSANLRVYGEDELTYDEMKERINAVAVDIGLSEENVTLNTEYLRIMTDPGTETMMIASVICLIVILFSALVIYSIYYVGVITDIQEIGKLKALGASRRQIAGMLYLQGAIVSAVSIPFGLLIGFLLPYFLFPLVLYATSTTALTLSYRDAIDALNLHMFSLPVLFAVTAAVVITVCLSLQKPIHMAKRVSPVEAIRYQESTTDKKSRKGHHTVKVSTLTFANLTRNKRRTAVTILTMGLSCVLFICVSAVLSSVSAKDLARWNIAEGDFRISLDYSRNDKEYPENNLDSLVQKNYFNEAFLAQLSAIEGVKKIQPAHGIILSSSDNGYALFQNFDGDPIRNDLSYFTREDIPELNKFLIQGSIDYDRMTANREVLCTHEYEFNQDGLSIGDVLTLTLHDGDRKIPFPTTLTALTQPETDFSVLVMTEDTWNELGFAYDPTTDIYLYVEDAQYDSVKEALKEIVSENEHFTLYSMDEEMRISRSSIALITYPVYLLLALIAVIGFISLINTMITSIITRKKELGILQALGLSDRQLVKMLSGEGLVFTAGTLFISLTLGNLFGWLLYKWAKQEQLMNISRYHYPLWESICLALVLLIGQLLITLLISKKMKKESLIERIRNQD